MDYLIPRFPPKPVPKDLADTWRYWYLSGAPYAAVGFAILLHLLPLAELLGGGYFARLTENLLMWSCWFWTVLVGLPLTMRTSGHQPFQSDGSLSPHTLDQWVLRPRRALMLQFVVPTVMFTIYSMMQ